MKRPKTKPTDEYTALQSLLRRVVTAPIDKVRAELATEKKNKSKPQRHPQFEFLVLDHVETDGTKVWRSILTTNRGEALPLQNDKVL